MNAERVKVDDNPVKVDDNPVKIDDNSNDGEKQGY